MRIISGIWAGKELVSPGKKVRATAEHVRDRWMDYLEPYLADAVILDLFCGSGALGLEALSRGAAQVDFVEDAPVALHALKANVAAYKLRAPLPGLRPTARKKAARVFKRDAIPFVGALDADRYDLAFADPPYASRKLDLVIARWLEVPFARLLAVEHAVDHEVPRGGKRLEFGDTLVTVYGVPRKADPRWRGPNKGPLAAGGKNPTRPQGNHLSGDP